MREQIAAGSHPNLEVLRRRPRDSKSFYTVIRVDDIRHMIDALHMTRGRAGHRLAVIDPIDDCNPSAANALLKMLEEPPQDATIFLVSHNPGRILPTILSRCRKVALRPIADADVTKAVTAQRQDVDRDALGQAVARAGGRPRRAFEALDADADGLLATLEAWLAKPAAAPDCRRTRSGRDDCRSGTHAGSGLCARAHRTLDARRSARERRGSRRQAAPCLGL